MREVGYVQKDGKNDFHGYKYASEANAIAALRPSLVKHGLVMIPSVKNVQHDEHGNTHVDVLYTIFDEHGNYLEFMASGSGNDRAKSGAVGDKGIYKALTGANKYALLKTFLLETGDDPEKEELHDENPVEKVDKQSVENMKLFIDKLQEMAEACTSVDDLSSLWKGNLSKLEEIEGIDPARFAGIKELFRNLKTQLKGKK